MKMLMKLRSVRLAVAVLALLTLMLINAPFGVASWTRPTSRIDPKSRIIVTLQVVQAPAAALETMENNYTNGPGKYALIYQALVGQTGEATEISVETENNILGSVRYSRILAYASHSHGKPTQSLLAMPTTLEATPHINPDGTVRVSLKIEIAEVTLLNTSVQAGVTPNTATQSLTTTRTFQTGVTDLLAAPVKIVHSGNSSTAGHQPAPMLFVTVTALPAESAAP